MTLRRQLLTYLAVNAGIVMVTGVIAFAPLWLTIGWATVLLMTLAFMVKRGWADGQDEIDNTHEKVR